MFLNVMLSGGSMSPAPSWINTFEIYNLPVKNVTTRFIGYLSERDAVRLTEFVEKRYKV